MKYYVGIDLGGTNIVAGVVDEEYNIIAKASTKTNCPRPEKEIADDMARMAIEAVKNAKLSMDQIEWIGVGTPGIANSETGIIEYSNNLGFKNTPMVKYIQETIDKPVFIENDANAAAYGEFVAGAAKGAKNAVCITLGTGVGGGIIIDGRIYSGSNFAGAEIGHTVIEVDGAQCSCGRKGCFEAYSSATGLIRMTKEAIAEHPDCIMAQSEKEKGKVTARTSFDCMRAGDKYAKAVVDKYIKYLAAGITNTINIFQPDILCIGGGVCNEGDPLLLPMKELVAKEVYTRNSEKNTEIVIAKLGNDAGIIGAAFLGRANQ
ncbi:MULTISPECIES: ROK family protein [Ruminococcus]|jgi:glucokinase|uniref:Glucokinase n=1 Tax=Ruminococcus flavefaciens TaxID=1265 RepID=A0A315XX34_RUMFL|nr:MULTISPECIES: ROK family glucokinase [Ruminococcus]MBR1430505.1 ROK family glucokinase [Ruminococcus sp.]MBR6996914.1 ROK family glucokinase [Ruminococcus sp.]PWJ11254.1 glucokinase [Ruminococcus flavefaciens]SSA50816.1 glucokinase [Ruminococcus flavefaciens]